MISFSTQLAKRRYLHREMRFHPVLDVSTVLPPSEHQR